MRLQTSFIHDDVNINDNPPILESTTVPDKQGRQILLNVYFSLKSPEKEFLKNAP